MTRRLTKLEADLRLFSVDPEDCWDILARHQDKAAARVTLLDVFEWLYELGEDSGYSHTQIAREFGVTKQAVSLRAAKMREVLVAELLREEV